MIAHPVDAVLVAAWLVFAHLVADFVLQNDWIAINKATGGRLGWTALGVHGFHVALCLVPAAFAFGIPGLAYLLLVAVSHMAVDRWKVHATRLAEGRGQASARARLEHGETLPGSGLGAAWTPWPGMLFLADQALHLTIALVGWIVVVQGTIPTRGFVDFVDAVIRTWDPATFHAATLTGVALLSLFLVNTRGAFYFSMAMATPRDVKPVADGAPGESHAPRTVPVATSPAPAVAFPGTASPVPAGAPALIVATVAAMERLLIVVFVLVGMPLGVALVVALDVAGRWRQLEDRAYAEYYLVSTLVSMSVAVGSGFLAAAALGTLG